MHAFQQSWQSAAEYLADIKSRQLLDNFWKLLDNIVIHAILLPFRLSGIKIEASTSPKVPVIFFAIDVEPSGRCVTDNQSHAMLCSFSLSI